MSPLYPSFSLQCLSSALHHHPSFPNAKALNLPFVRTRSREVNAQQKRERMKGGGKGREGGRAGKW